MPVDQALDLGALCRRNTNSATTIGGLERNKLAESEEVQMVMISCFLRTGYRQLRLVIRSMHSEEVLIDRWMMLRTRG